jgi:hypothetical protein
MQAGGKLDTSAPALTRARKGLIKMTQADSVHSTPPTNTSANTPSSSRRRFLVQAAGAAAGGAALGMALPLPAPAATPQGLPDPAFALIAAKLAADVAHCEAIDAQDEAETHHAYGSAAVEEAWNRCCDACSVVNETDWRLATTLPTTLAGVAAVLRFANAIEDDGMEWPGTDTIGSEGWHYQLRGDHGRGNRGHHSAGGASMSNIIELSALRAARVQKCVLPSKNAAPFESRVTGRRRAGPPIYTLAFRSYASIVESAEADLMRDVCIDVDKAQTKPKAMRDSCSEIANWQRRA